MIEGHGTYVSDDRGASWSKKSGHNTAGNYYTELIAHPTDKDVVIQWIPTATSARTVE